jgi:N-acetylglutamate synthase-like GNAT family acetyltransferase
MKMTFEETVSTLQIRKAELGDAADIARLVGQLGYSTSSQEIKNRLVGLASQEHAALFVALCDEHVVGWIQVLRVCHIMTDPYCEIGGLVIEEEQRCRGAGSELLEKAEEWARQAGLSSVWIRSNVIRLQAHEFYLARGYSLFKDQHVFRKDLVENLSDQS